VFLTTSLNAVRTLRGGYRHGPGGNAVRRERYRQPDPDRHLSCCIHSMLLHITDLYTVASALVDRSKTEGPDDDRLLASVRDLAQQMRFVMRLKREENAFVATAESWLDRSRADLAATILAEVLAKRVNP
jgi:hypothetical protein